MGVKSCTIKPQQKTTKHKLCTYFFLCAVCIVDTLEKQLLWDKYWDVTVHKIRWCLFFWITHICHQRKMPYILLSYVCAYIFNSLWPGDTMWYHKSWPSLVQVMAHCLTGLSHYLIKFWLVNWTHRKKLQQNFQQQAINFNQEYTCVLCNMDTIAFRPQCVNDPSGTETEIFWVN